MRFPRPHKAHFKRYIFILVAVVSLTGLGVYANPVKHTPPVKHSVHSTPHKSDSSSYQSIKLHGASPDSSSSNISDGVSTYTNSAGNTVESPDYNPTGASAMCVDGTFSHSQTASGTCSSHGGVDHWLNSPSPTYTPAPVCTSSQIQAQIDSENSRHDSAIANIQFQYSQQGGLGSGLEANAINQENQLHQQYLAPLQAQLSTASC